MRTLSIVLGAAALAAAVILYGMLAGEGEGDPAVAPVTVAPVEGSGAGAGSHGAGTVADWLANLERHDPPQPVPDTAFQTADGAPVSLADFQGRGVVVNLWATWCSPCVREMPSLDRLQAEVAADGIDVVAVSSDRGGMNAVGPFLQEHGLANLKPYLDPKAAFTMALEGRGLPRTYIINPDGQITASYVGPAEWDEPEMVAAVRELAR